MYSGGDSNLIARSFITHRDLTSSRIADTYLGINQHLNTNRIVCRIKEQQQQQRILKAIVYCNNNNRHHHHRRHSRRHHCRRCRVILYQ